MTGLLFRPATPDDAPAIVDLFWQVAPVGRTEDYWRWMNEKGPFGPSLVEVIEIDGRITGHYAVMPIELHRRNRTIKAGFAMQVCTHRGHRGLSYLRPMCDRVWQRCADHGMEVVYGFPNRHIWTIYRRMMRWQPIAHFRSLQYALAERGAPSLYEAADLRVTYETAFPEAIDALWAI
jgi:hypothetical protein